MLFLILLNLFNSVANQLEVLNHLRIPIGGLPLGILETSAILLFFYAAIFGGGHARAYPSRRMNPVFVVTLTLLLIALVFGAIDSLVQQIRLEIFTREARELGAWPLF